MNGPWPKGTHILKVKLGHRVPSMQVPVGATGVVHGYAPHKSPSMRGRMGVQIMLDHPHRGTREWTSIPELWKRIDDNDKTQFVDSIWNPTKITEDASN